MTRTAQQVFREMYRETLKRPLTHAELVEEIENLYRKAAKGTLDDRQEYAFAALDLGRMSLEQARALAK